MRTPQQLFDTSVNHLRQQDKKSLDGKKCRYRDAEGNKCAIGALIPDQDYNPKMEGFVIDNIVGWWFVPPELDIEFQENMRLLSELQRIHDQYPVEEWEEAWEHTAQYFDLRYTPTPKKS